MKVQEEPRTSWAKKQRCAQRMMVTCQKDTEYIQTFWKTVLQFL